MFTISNFKADILKRGTLRTNRFLAKIVPPKFVTDKSSFPSTVSRYKRDNLSADLSIRCEAVSTPGVSLQTVEGPFRYGYGPVDKQAVGAIIEPFSLRFLCDKDGEIQQFFHDWMNFIVSFSNKGLGADGNYIHSDERKAYEVQYKSNYATDIIVDIFDELDTKIITYTARKAYPERMNNIELDWGDDNNLIKMEIPFIYKDYDVQFYRRPPDNSASNQIPTDDTILYPPKTIHGANPFKITKP